jgi:hypothetical protein
VGGKLPRLLLSLHPGDLMASGPFLRPKKPYVPPGGLKFQTIFSPLIFKDDPFKRPSKAAIIAWGKAKKKKK